MPRRRSLSLRGSSSREMGAKLAGCRVDFDSISARRILSGDTLNSSIAVSIALSWARLDEAAADSAAGAELLRKA